jgi:hypothetical protein
MPAPKRVSDAAVTAAISAWGGNVTAAADSLGIWPANLRKRLNALGIDPARVRTKGADSAERPTPNTSIGSHPFASAPYGGVAPLVGTGHQSAGGIFSTRAKAPNIPLMQAAAKNEEEEAAPIRTVVPKHTPIRMKDEQRARLREAKLDLGARYRIETDENAILETFFDERFEEWLTGKLNGKAKK